MRPAHRPGHTTSPAPVVDPDRIVRDVKASMPAGPMIQSGVVGFVVLILAAISAVLLARAVLHLAGETRWAVVLPFATMLAACGPVLGARLSGGLDSAVLLQIGLSIAVLALLWTRSPGLPIFVRPAHRPPSRCCRGGGRCLHSGDLGGLSEHVLG